MDIAKQNLENQQHIEQVDNVKDENETNGVLDVEVNGATDNEMTKEDTTPEAASSPREETRAERIQRRTQEIKAKIDVLQNEYHSLRSGLEKEQESNAKEEMQLRISTIRRQLDIAEQELLQLRHVR